MTLQDLGSIGELIAAIATVATLGYLAVQMRQNTRALSSATFQEIARDMNGSSDVIATQGELAAILVKSQDGLENLTPAELTRYSFLMLASFRRFEGVFVQRELGSLDPSLSVGFERSMLSAASGVAGRKWWQETGRFAFSDRFVAHVDEAFKANIELIHPGFGKRFDND